MDVTLAMAVTPAGAAILTTIIIQLIKPSILPAWTPRLAVIAGITITLLASWALGIVDRAGLAQAVINGLLAGASSVGIYEVIKAREVPRG